MKKIFFSIFVFLSYFLVAYNVNAAQPTGCIYKKVEDTIDCNKEADVDSCEKAKSYETYYASYYDELYVKSSYDKVYKQFEDENYKNMYHRFKKIYDNGETLFEDVGSSLDEGIASCRNEIYWSSKYGWHSQLKTDEYTTEHGVLKKYQNVKVYRKVDGAICIYTEPNQKIEGLDDRIVFRYFVTRGFMTSNFQKFGAGFANRVLGSTVRPTDFGSANQNGIVENFKCPKLSYSNDTGKSIMSVDPKGEKQYDSKYSYISVDSTYKPPSENPGDDNSTDPDNSLTNYRTCALGDVTFILDVTNTKKWVSVTTVNGCLQTNGYTVTQLYDFTRERCVYETFSTIMKDDTFCTLEPSVSNHCDKVMSFEIGKYEVANVTGAKKVEIPGSGPQCQYTISVTNNEGEVRKETLTDTTIYYGHDANNFACDSEKAYLECSDGSTGIKTCKVNRCNYEVVQIDRYTPICGIFKPTENGGRAFPIVKNLYRMLKIVIPVFVFALTVAEFLKVLFNGEEKTMKEAFQATYKRLILMAVLILLPFIIEFIIRVAGVSQDCLQHLI